LQAFVARARRALGRSPLEVSLVVAALGAALYVLAAPFAVSRYPPMTDLPFHATHTATFRHYWDPAYHLREQFELHPVSVPYMSMYAIGAALMLVLPVVLSVKIASAIMLGLVPAGLAVMFHGMKKSPLLGLLGLGLCWCNLAHWGFLNHIGAMGLFAMTIGVTLMLLERPTMGRQLALALVLIALYFTHIFRFPFGICAVIGTTLVMYPATRRIRPVLLPLVPVAALFALWLRIRPTALTGKVGALSFHSERFKEFVPLLFGGFRDPAEKRYFLIYLQLAIAVGLVCAVASAVRYYRGVQRARAWDVGATLAVLGCVTTFLLFFLVMPLWLGSWWYVYPREATTTTFMLLGLCPDLPRRAVLRVPLTLAMIVGGLGVARVVVKNYAEFDAQAQQFAAITRQIPQAPRLFYLIFDNGGSTRTTSPFMHLPAWVQAEKGGWLSWHFAVWNASPVAFRPRDQPGAVVTPKTPPRWEWTPGQFNLKMTPFFDWFLVRQAASPDTLFKADPTIQRVDHVGNWWLYKRVTRS
jgi:hypothetical protein